MARKGNFDILGHYTWCIPSVGDMFILLIFLLLGALLGNGVVMLFSLAVGPQAALEYSTLLSYPIMFIPPMIWASSVSRRNSLNCRGIALDNGNFAPLGGWRCVLLVIVGTIACGVVGDAAGSVLPPMPEWLESALNNMTNGNLLVNFLCVSIFAPFFEEWLCRGMVLRGLLGRKMKPVWAIIISALFFAVIHMNPWQAIPAFILGCLFGYVYYHTGSLKLTMLMHFTNNTAALMLAQIDSLKDKDTWMDVFGQSFWFVFAGCVLLLALVVLAFRRTDASKSLGTVPPLFGE